MVRVDVEATLRSLQRLDKDIQTLAQKRKRVLYTLQANCKHEDLVEADYKSYQFSDSALPPIRACLACGMAEEGWGSGYQVLRHKREVNFIEIGVPRVSRDSLGSLRRGLYITDRDKGPLIRREVTVKDLIRKAISGNETAEDEALDECD